MVEIDEPVELVKVSTVRAKSWLPVSGTVTSRETVKPAAVPRQAEALPAVGRAVSARGGAEQAAADV